MTSFFHAYDLRGTYPDEIDEDAARKVGRSFGTLTDSDTVIVGRDGRTHGEKIKNAFVEGIISTGTDVRDAGTVPSPVVYFGVKEHGIPAAVVTASHNPSHYTGFKFMHSDCRAMSRDSGMAEMEEIYESESFHSGQEGEVEALELKEDYVDWIASKFEATGLEVAVDYGNGVATVIGPEMFEAMGASHRGIDDELDGDFPNHLPDPTDSEAQQHLIDNMDGEDLGILFDGDGDRAGFVIDGDYVTEDEILSLFASEILEEQKGTVIHDLRASKLLKEVVRDHGGKAVESRVGHTFISQLIFEHEDSVFAGELSGHYYFPGMGAPFDDGLFAAAFMAQIVYQGKHSRLDEFTDYPVSPELRIDCPEDAKKLVIEAMKRRFSDRPTSDKDGVKIEFEKGWALVRPSNTQPKMSVRCEADTEEALEEILEEVESAVRESIEELG
jgi:phosphomannomutase/phosphoglucomutase